MNTSSYPMVPANLADAMKCAREGQFVLAGRHLERAYVRLYEPSDRAYRTPIWNHYRMIYRAVFEAVHIAEGTL